MSKRIKILLVFLLLSISNLLFAQLPISSSSTIAGNTTATSTIIFDATITNLSNPSSVTINNSAITEASITASNTLRVIYTGLAASTTYIVTIPASIVLSTVGATPSDAGTIVFTSAKNIITIANQERSIAENSANSTNVGAVLVTTGTPDSFSITAGNDNTAFAIDNSGQISVNDSNQLDTETTPTYLLSVVITRVDADNQTADVTITITNVNENIISIANQERSIAENSANSTNVGAVLVTTGTPDSFSITAGNDNTAFAIDNSGQISVNDSNQLDTETTPTYLLSVVITRVDADNQTADVTITITNVNENIISIANQERSIAENSANSTNVGAVLVTTGTPDSFSITAGNDNTAFAIDNSGQISVNDSNQLDTETTPTYLLSVVITRVDADNQTADVTITITNVNENIISIANQERSIAENSANSTNVGAVLVTTGTPDSFSITAGNDNTAFAIDNSGQISVNDSNQLDTETTPTYLLSVVITRVDADNQTADVTITITNVNENIISIANQERSIAENSANSTNVGAVLVTTGTPDSFSITAGNDNTAFAIDNSGQISVNDSNQLDTETTPTYLLSVVITRVDADNQTADVTITITNVNENIISIANQERSIAENSANSTNVGAVLVTTGTPDSFSITAGNDNTAFAIDNSGQISVNDSNQLDTETTPTYLLSVVITRVDADNQTADVTITITNVNENIISIANQERSIAENSANSTNVGAVLVTTGTPDSFSITAGNDNTAFAIDNSGQISVNDSNQLDTETTPTYLLSVVITRVDADNQTADVTITITNVNENIISIANQERSIAENSANSTNVGAVLVTTGTPDSFSITAGNDNTAFAIDNSGQISVNDSNQLDTETTPTYLLSVVITRVDADNQTADVTITITNVNENIISIANQERSIAENSANSTNVGAVLVTTGTPDSFSITAGNDNTAFAIDNSGQISVNDSNQLDTETTPTYLLSVVITRVDADNQTADVTITITNVNENIISIANQERSIAENSANSTNVGAVLVTTGTPDSFSITAGNDNTAFAIDNSGQISVNDSNQLDTETTPTYLLSVVITRVDADNQTADVTITITNVNENIISIANQERSIAENSANSTNVGAVLVTTGTPDSFSITAGNDNTAFAIDNSGQISVNDSNQLDTETTPTYLLSVVITRVDADNQTADVTITITNVNENIISIANQERSIAENSANSTNVGAVLVTTGTPDSFSITAGNDNTAFAIDNSGQISVNDSNQLDTETTPTYLLSVVITRVDADNQTADVTITITNVNENIISIANQERSIAENSANSTNVGAVLVTTGTPDSFSITAGNDNTAFAIDNSGQISVNDSNQLDTETTPTYLLSVVITRVDADNQTADVTITITNVNENIISIANQERSIAENSANSTNVGAVLVTTGTPDSFSITAGNDNTAFAIDNSGQISVNDSNQLDTETTPTYLLSVVITRVDADNQTADVTITITNVNENIISIANQERSIAENSANSTNVGAVLVTTGTPDSFSITAGNDNTAFAIDNSGQISVNDSNQLDTETTPTYLLSVVITRVDADNQTADVTITITNVNENIISIANQERSIAENSANSTNVGAVLVTTGTPDSFSITAGNDNTAFAIDNSGQISVNDSNQLDTETTPTYLLSVVITRVDTDNQTADITITITNVNENIISIANQERSIAENSANSTNVGAVLVTTGTPDSFSITAGNDNTAFAIDNSGQISVNDSNQLDTETTPTYLLSVVITRVDADNQTADVTITITNVNENIISIANQERSIAENSANSTNVGAVLVTTGTPDSFSITAGNDNTAFAIDNSGQISVNDSNQLDTETTPTYLLSVVITRVDADNQTADVTITITNVNENIISIANQERSIAENSANSTNVGAVLVTTGTPDSFSITAGNDNTAFAIDNSGQISVNDSNQLDTETTPTYLLSVVITRVDADNQTADVTITITNVNENIISIANQERSIAENSANSTNVGAVLVTTGTPDSFSITAGNDNTAFAIDNSGQISVNDSNQLDTETTPTYLLSVVITRVDTDNQTADVTITITNVNENIISIANQERSIAENSANSTNVGAVLVTTGTPDSFSITAGNDNTAFAIDNSGQISVNDSNQLDTETTPTYLLSVVITRVDADNQTADVTITITNVNENIISIANQERSIAENSANSTNVGAVLVTTGTPDSFSITAGNDNTAFAIDNSGQISVNDSNQLDTETTPTYLLSVVITRVDADNQTADVTITITNVNENIISIANQERSIAENSANSTNVGAVLVTTGTPDSFSITAGNDNTAFAIDNSGQISVNDSNQLDTETTPTYLLSVVITRVDADNQTADVTITITNVNENIISIANQERSIAENSANSTNVGAVLVTTGTPDSFSITAGNDNTAFAIDNSGQISVNDSNQLDTETTPTYLLSVVITRVDADNQTADVTITITNVNENIISIANQERSIAENSANSTNVGAVLVTTGTPDSFSITAGNDNTAFAIDNSGQISVNDSNQLDTETTPTYLLSVVITRVDADNQTADVTITITNVNENIISIANQERSIAENSANSTNVGAVLVTTGTPDSFSITAGNDNTAFAIDNSGQISVNDSNQLDTETTPTYLLSVVITRVDADNQTADVTITITNVNENIISIANQERSIAENSANSTNVGAVLVTTGTPDSFSITAGNDNTAFAIDNSGQISVNDSNQLDTETTPTYLLSVVITRVDTDNQTADVTITITNVNENIISIANQERSIAENSANSTNVGAVLVTTGTPDSFSITAGNDNTAFAIDNSGQISVNDSNQLDTETTPTYLLSVVITRVDADNQTADVTITITNVNENIISIANQERSIAENSANSTNVGAVLVTTGTPDSFSITAGNDNTAFAIDNSGQISVNDSNQLDTETTPTYLLSVVITRVDADNQTADVTITITNVNENIISIANQERSIAENSANSTNVGAVLVTTGTPDSFSITAGNDNTAFAIDNSGQISVNDSNQLDTETTPTYLLSVVITRVDADNQTADVTITITNVNENIISIANQERSIAENSANSTNVGAVLVTTGTPDSFSITAGNDNTAFAIDNSGQISVNDSNQLDTETTPTYLLSVVITRVDADNQTADVTITITNVNDNAPIGFVDIESTNIGVSITFNLVDNDNDPDGNDITIASVSKVSTGTVVINSGSKTISYTPPTGFSGNATFTYIPTDGTLTGLNTTVTITVTDLALIITPSNTQNTTAGVAVMFFVELTDLVTSNQVNITSISLADNTATNSIWSVATSATNVATLVYQSNRIATETSLIAKINNVNFSIPNVTVLPTSFSAASSTIVANPSPSIITADNQVSFTITFKDRFGNIVNDDSNIAPLTAQVSSDFSTITLGTINTNTATAIYSVNSPGTGNDEVSFYANGILIASTINITVNVGVASTTQSTATISSASTTVGTSITIIVTLRDNNNNLTNTGNASLSISSEGINIASTTFTGANGVYRATITSLVAQIATFTVFVDNSTITLTPSTATFIPAQPDTLTATAQTSSTINVLWTITTTGENYYYLYRATTLLNSNYNQIYEGVTRSYIDNQGLAPSSTYYYTLRACINSDISTCSVSSTTSIATTKATFSLDVDNNGTTNAKDGLIILRFLAGSSNENLITGLVDGNSISTAQIRAYLITHIARLDVDGNGIADSATDGFLIIRYLNNPNDTNLTNEIIGNNNPSRTTADSIRTYLNQFYQQ